MVSAHVVRFLARSRMTEPRFIRKGHRTEVGGRLDDSPLVVAVVVVEPPGGGGGGGSSRLVVAASRRLSRVSQAVGVAPAAVGETADRRRWRTGRIHGRLVHR